MIIEYALDQKLDEQGQPEMFTSDAYLILPRGATDHLDENGLPIIGSEVYPGMLLIAKFGTTKSYRREAMPDDLNRWSEGEETLLQKYKHMAYDASFYVPMGVRGTVKEAYFEPLGRFKRAIVRIEKAIPT